MWRANSWAGMRSFFQVVAATAILAAAGSCDAPTAPVDHDVEGSWSENTHGMLNPGNSFLVDLHESGGVVQGVGTFSGEAGPMGALVVSGTISHDSLQLAIVAIVGSGTVPVRTDTSHFAGVLTSRDRIDGTLTENNLATAFGLVRVAGRMAASVMVSGKSPGAPQSHPRRLQYCMKAANVGTPSARIAASASL